MFNGINLQTGNVFILVHVIYIATEIIMIMSSIIEILEILLAHSLSGGSLNKLSNFLKLRPKKVSEI